MKPLETCLCWALQLLFSSVSPPVWCLLSLRSGGRPALSAPPAATTHLPPIRLIAFHPPAPAAQPRLITQPLPLPLHQLLWA